MSRRICCICVREAAVRTREDADAGRGAVDEYAGAPHEQHARHRDVDRAEDPARDGRDRERRRGEDGGGDGCRSHEGAPRRDDADPADDAVREGADESAGAEDDPEDRRRPRALTALVAEQVLPGRPDGSRSRSRHRGGQCQRRRAGDEPRTPLLRARPCGALGRDDHRRAHRGGGAYPGEHRPRETPLLVREQRDRSRHKHTEPGARVDEGLHAVPKTVFPPELVVRASTAG